ncbi:hypothetical protein KSS87_011821 [Heliosperma pusillum]|nr:hypothetical protein KSS87_011821 [Heliosperma pusillum]
MASIPIAHQCLDILQPPPLLKMQTDKQANLQVQVSPFVRCTKRRITKTAFEECGILSDKWGNLDPNILRQIFCRVPIVDLFFMASSVCRSWEAVCWDYLFWSHNILDMSLRGVGLGMADMSAIALLPLDPTVEPTLAPGFFGLLDSTDSYLKMAATLMRKLKRIMYGEGIYNSTNTWRSTIETIILPYDLEISDAHLLYIAERTPSVRHVLILCPSMLTLGGFIKALQNWKHVREINLGPLNFGVFPQFISEIGKICHKLESLHIHEHAFLVDRSCAALIGKNLPGLRKLEFDSGIVQPGAVSTLYIMCLQLEEIYFNGCQRVRDSETWEYPPWFDTYRLSLSVGEEGLAKLDVKPCPISIERLMGMPGFFTREELAKRLSSREYLEGRAKTRLQEDIEYWIYSSCYTARRKCSHP